MDATVMLYAGINLLGVLISSVSQVLLKKSAMKSHDSAIREYLNPYVIFAYALFVGSTLLSVVAYRGIPLSMGPILEATGYLYVTAFGVALFHEKMSTKKLVALVLIVGGIVIYSTGL